MKMPKARSFYRNLEKATEELILPVNDYMQLSSSSW